MTTTSPLPQTDAGRIELTFTEVGNAQVATLLIDRADKLNALTLELLADLDVRRAGHPALERLSQRTGETAALLVWNGHEAVVVEQIASTCANAPLVTTRCRAGSSPDTTMVRRRRSKS